MRETDLFGFVAGKYLWLNKKLPDGPNDQTRAYDGPHGGYMRRKRFGDEVPIELQDDKYLGHQNSRTHPTLSSETLASPMRRLKNRSVKDGVKVVGSFGRQLTDCPGTRMPLSLPQSWPEAGKTTVRPPIYVAVESIKCISIRSKHKRNHGLINEASHPSSAQLAPLTK